MQSAIEPRAGTDGPAAGGSARRLVELLPQYRSLELGIYVLYPSRKHVLPKSGS